MEDQERASTPNADAEAAALERTIRINAAKLEWAALRDWQRNGEKGARPATPLLDENTEKFAPIRVGTAKGNSRKVTGPKLSTSDVAVIVKSALADDRLLSEAGAWKLVAGCSERATLKRVFAAEQKAAGIVEADIRKERATARAQRAWATMRAAGVKPAAKPKTTGGPKGSTSLKRALKDVDAILAAHDANPTGKKARRATTKAAKDAQSKRGPVPELIKLPVAPNAEKPKTKAAQHAEQRAAFEHLPPTVTAVRRKATAAKGAATKAAKRTAKEVRNDAKHAPKRTQKTA